MSDEHWLICSIPDGLGRYREIADVLSDLDVWMALDGTDVEIYCAFDDWATREAVYLSLGIPDLVAPVAEA